MHALDRLNIFKFCCSSLIFEEEHSLEIDVPPLHSSRPRADNSIHFNPESIYHRHFNSYIFKESDITLDKMEE